MPLIACPDCQKEVSDAAASCPNCGHPIGSPTDRSRSERTLTTQATGKTAKGQQLLAVLVLIIGVFLYGQDQQVGLTVVLIGIAWFIGARIYAWWHYG